MTDTDEQHQTKEIRLLIAELSENNRRLAALQRSMDLLVQAAQRQDIRTAVLETSIDVIKVSVITKADYYAELHANAWRLLYFGCGLAFAVVVAVGAICDVV